MLDRELMGYPLYQSSDGSGAFLVCSELMPNANATELIRCVSTVFEDNEELRAEEMKRFLFIITGAMIFLMQTGFAMLCAGSVRIKNVQNTLLKNLLDACGAALAFFFVGYAFAFGGQDDSTATTFIGSSGFFTTDPSPAFWFFQFTFSATSVTIVAGTLAERCQMVAYLFYSIFLAGFVYPVVAHNVWSFNGFMSHSNVSPLLGSGAIDFAGSGVVHLTGGSTALYATLILGPRRGRFYDSQGSPLQKPKPLPGHSVALQVLGTLILWFGWFGFNSGSALTLQNPNIGAVAANAAASTALSGAAGGVTALFVDLWLEERRTGEVSYTILMAMNGSLAGLVASTSGCAVFEPWAAALTGAIAGLFYLCGSKLLVRNRIDDAVDAVPVHMLGGMWGLIATGLLASPRKLELAYGTSQHPGWFYSLGQGDWDAHLLGCQTIELLFIFSWTLVTMLPFFFMLNYKGWFRADSLEELVGLDISYHGGIHCHDHDGVRKEYLEAYNKRKGELRQRRDNSGKSYGDDDWTKTYGIPDGSFRCEFTATSVTDEKTMASDPEMNQEAAALEALVEE